MLEENCAIWPAGLEFELFLFVSFFTSGPRLLLRLGCVISLHLRCRDVCFGVPDIPSATIWIQIQV